MSSPLKSLVLVLLAGCAAGPIVAAIVNAPALNWTLPLFTKEGYRSWLARGSEAHAVTEHEFAVTDLSLTFFSGDGTNRVETVILSPAATFLPDTKIAQGEQSVRFVRDDLEASGTRWVYRHAEKKISLDGNVHVKFHAELKDLLK